MELREASTRRRPGRYREFGGPTGVERPMFVHEDPTFDPELALHCAFPSLDTGHDGPGPSAVWKERKRLKAAAAKHPVIVIEGDGDGDGDDAEATPSPPPSPSHTGADRLLLSVRRAGLPVVSITTRPRSPVSSEANVPQRKAKTVSLARKTPPGFVPYGQTVPPATGGSSDDKFKIRDIGRQYPDWPKLTDGVKYIIIHEITNDGMSFTRAYERLRLIGGEVTEMIELIRREKGKMQRNEEAIAQYDPLANAGWLDSMDENIQLERARLNGEDVTQAPNTSQVHAPPREALVTDSLPGKDINKGKAFLNFMGLPDAAANLGFYQGSMGQDYDITLNHLKEDGWEDMVPAFRIGCEDEVHAMEEADMNAKEANPQRLLDGKLPNELYAPPGTLNQGKIAKEPFVPEVIGDGLHPDNYLTKLPDGTFFNWKDGTIVEDREELLVNVEPAIHVAQQDIAIPTVEDDGFGFDDPALGDEADLMDIDDLLDFSMLDQDDADGQSDSWFGSSSSRQGEARVPSQVSQLTIDAPENQLPAFRFDPVFPTRTLPVEPRQQFPTIDQRYLTRHSPLRDIQSEPPEEELLTIDPRLLSSNLTVLEPSPAVAQEVDEILSRYKDVLKSPPAKKSRHSGRLGGEDPEYELLDDLPDFPPGTLPDVIPDVLPDAPVSQKKKKQKRVQFEDDDYEESDEEYIEPQKNTPRGQKTQKAAARAEPASQKTQKAATRAQPVRSSGRIKQAVGNTLTSEDSPAPRSTRRASVFNPMPATPVKNTSKESEDVALDEPVEGVARWPRVAELQAHDRNPMIPKQTTSVGEQPANLTTSETREKATNKRAPVSSPIGASSPVAFPAVTIVLGTPIYSDPEPGSTPVSLSRPSRTSTPVPAVHHEEPTLHPDQDGTSTLNWSDILQSNTFDPRANATPDLVGEDATGLESENPNPESEPHARKRKGDESAVAYPEGVKPAKKPRARKSAEGTGDGAAPMLFNRQSHTPIPIPVVTNFRSLVGSGVSPSIRDIASQYVPAQAESAAGSSRLTAQNMMDRVDIMGMGGARAEREIFQNREMSKAASSSHGSVGHGNNSSPLSVDSAVFSPPSSMTLRPRARASSPGLSAVPRNPHETSVNRSIGPPSRVPQRSNLPPYGPTSSMMNRPVVGSSVPTSQVPSLSSNGYSSALDTDSIEWLKRTSGASGSPQVRPASTAAIMTPSTVQEFRRPSYGAVSTANILQAQMEAKAKKNADPDAPMKSYHEKVKAQTHKTMLQKTGAQTTQPPITNAEAPSTPSGTQFTPTGTTARDHPQVRMQGQTPSTTTSIPGAPANTPPAASRTTRSGRAGTGIPNAFPRDYVEGTGPLLKQGTRKASSQQGGVQQGAPAPAPTMLMPVAQPRQTRQASSSQQGPFAAPLMQEAPADTPATTSRTMRSGRAGIPNSWSRDFVEGTRLVLKNGTTRQAASSSQQGGVQQGPFAPLTTMLMAPVAQQGTTRQTRSQQGASAAAPTPMLMQETTATASRTTRSGRAGVRQAFSRPYEDGVRPLPRQGVQQTQQGGQQGPQQQQSTTQQSTSMEMMDPNDTEAIDPRLLDPRLLDPHL